MAARRIIILGNGGAACHAVQAAREAGFDGEIVMLSDADEPAFNPMLAPYYLKGRLAWKDCFPFGDDFYRRHEVICHFGSLVTALDARDRTVSTAHGRQFAYDQCLVATGASASIPPVPGLQASSLACPLRTSRSVRHLEKNLVHSRKAVVLGAGLVGLKIAEILAAKGARTLVADVADQVMPAGAHPLAAAFIQRRYEQHGIEFALGCALQGLEEKESGVCCFFPQAVFADADFVGVCTGIRANLPFIDRRQVKVEQGILIDACGRTSAAGLFAAGDCAQGINALTGRHQYLGTWANACCQGRAAGLAMAGRPMGFTGAVPQHISPFFDWTYAQVGVVEAAGDDVRVETSGDPFEGSGKFKLLVYERDRLVGANLINCTEQIGAIKYTILQGRPWSAAEAWRG